MANAGYPAPNTAKNISVAHGVKLFFQNDTGTTWLDLGDVTDLTVTPAAEYVDYMSNHDGRMGLAKRVLSMREVLIDCTLSEINEENLQLMLLGGSVSDSATFDYLHQETLTAVAGGPWTLSKTPATTPELVVKKTDGTTLTDVTDYSLSGSTLSRTSDSTALPDTETQLNVQYRVTQTSGRKMDLIDGDAFTTGKIQFQVSNELGGVQQIFELTSAVISPNGAINLPMDGIQSLPLSIRTTTNSANTLGSVYLLNK